MSGRFPGLFRAARLRACPGPSELTEAGAIYHSLNRGNARQAIFTKAEDFDAFERIPADGLRRYPCEILSYC